MPKYKFEIAKNILNDADKDRILCIYLSSDPSAIDWSKAAKDFGAPSVEAFRKAISRMLKRLEDAGARDGCGKVAAKPFQNMRKRKLKCEDEASDEIEYTPTKRGRKADSNAREQSVDSDGEFEDSGHDQ